MIIITNYTLIKHVFILLKKEFIKFNSSSSSYYYFFYFFFLNQYLFYDKEIKKKRAATDNVDVPNQPLNYDFFLFHA